MYNWQQYNFPNLPGIYLMLNQNDKIIYIGKAKNLKKRIASYFNKNNKSFKTKILVKNIYSINYIITNNEIEALILEDNYIKKHKPKFNIRLKDDKRYPYIVIDLNEKFPKLYFKRQLFNTENKIIFGPLPSSRATRKIINSLNEIFMLRTCNNFNSIKKACLYYHIKKCSAPCTNKISEENYKKNIYKVINFLKGKKKKIIENFKIKMYEYSKKQKYEDAKEYRDKIESLESLFFIQKIDNKELNSYDVIAFSKNNKNAILQLFCYRQGKLVYNHFYNYNIEAEIDDTENLIERFIIHNYKNAIDIPENIIIDRNLENIFSIEEWLKKKRQSKVSIIFPKKGKKKDLLNFAIQNTKLLLEQENIKIKINKKKLDNLKTKLSLTETPFIISGFDISNLNGTNAVGSAVTFIDGKPARKYYRKYKIKTVFQIDDFSMMNELLIRHFKNCLENKIIMPNLILIDGGLQHLNIAIDVLRNKYNLSEKISIISLAKKEELIFKENKNKPIVLDKSSAELRLLQFIRDETHRFGITYHKNLRSKNIDISVLDSIKGISKKRKLLLLQHFKSIDNIKYATLKELIQIKGISQKIAENIINVFKL